MSLLLTAVQSLDGRLPEGPVHRTIIALDVEGSTKRTNPDKRQLRRGLYWLTGRALASAGVAEKYLEPKADRGDGVMILIRPDDEVPKTLILGRLIPMLAALLSEHNAAMTRPELRLRLRAVVHAGEIHEDENGFYGDDIDAAFRLLEAPKLKKALQDAPESPLILVVSEEIYHSIVQQEYVQAGPFQPLVRVRVGHRFRRGWVNTPIPIPVPPEPSGMDRRTQGRLAAAPRLAIAPLNEPGHVVPENGTGVNGTGVNGTGVNGTGVNGSGVNGSAGPPPERE